MVSPGIGSRVIRGFLHSTTSDMEGDMRDFAINAATLIGASLVLAFFI